MRKVQNVMLEIKVPKEVLKPMRAMETVMAGLWQTIYAPPDWWEKWIDGEVQLSYHFEIVSLGGEAHFFLKIPAKLRDPVEAVIYSQYPEAEMIVVDDYTKKVPKDIPNKEWNLWAADYKLLRPDAYPIKTFIDFETEREALEVKRVDPLSLLMEAMSKIKPDEQLWVQMSAEPVGPEENPWVKKGLKLRDELARRTPKKVKYNNILFDVANVLITGNPPEEAEKKDEIMPPEMKLTPGERDILSALERKISKRGFQTNIRFIYLGKRSVFFTTNLRLVFGFFAAFNSEHLNSLVPFGRTMTKIHKSWFLPLNLILKRRMYLRQRKIFKNYLRRNSPFFPLRGGTFILNTEEIATLFHFPGRGVAPAPFMQRIESKKGEAPPGLPIE